MSDPTTPSDDDTPGLDDMRAAVAKLSKESRALKPAAETAPDAEPDDDGRQADALRRAEAILFASGVPIDATTLAAALPPGVEAGDVLVKLQAAYRNKGVQLVELAGKWRFQTAPDLAFLFEETRDQPRQLSRAAMETLAIIAYCQPVTRAEIANVRGVEVSSGTLDVLMETGWVKPRGRRRTPGRPHTYGVTDAFLVHFGLDSLDSLPGWDELKASGLLSAEIPRDFVAPGSPIDPATGELLAEDPLEEGEFQPNYLADGSDS
jgi:segregation and condensation protein B